MSFGISGFYFVSMIIRARKPWGLKIDENYSPELSIIIPTHNESGIIKFKLLNLSRLDYPKSLLQFIVVDSNSDDETLRIAEDFAKEHSNLDFQLLTLAEKGKSAALNFALEHAKGEIVLISDADCFYPRDIIQKSMPYLSNPAIGAISGPKIILNGHSSKTATAEMGYLEAMNLLKLGESKSGFTPLFEGGFSAYKKGLVKVFDPYQTGSDDCGTIIKLAENSQSAILVPEAAFFTTFPETRKERLSIKIRRSNQLVRVFSTYLSLLSHKRVKVTKWVILPNIMMYLFSPVFFILFLPMTAITFVKYPYLVLSLIILLVPKIGRLLIELVQGYLVLFVSLFSVASKKSFLTWNKPLDRHLLTEEMLRKQNLI